MSREIKLVIKTGIIHGDYVCRRNNAFFLQCPKLSEQVLACPAQGLQRSISDERREVPKINHLSLSLKARREMRACKYTSNRCVVTLSLISGCVVISNDQLFICLMKNKDLFGFPSKNHFNERRHRRHQSVYLK